jgi:hypothetical protein
MKEKGVGLHVKKIKGHGWGRGLVSAKYKKLGLGFFVVALNFCL